MRLAAQRIEFRTSMRYAGFRCVSRDAPGWMHTTLAVGCTPIHAMVESLPL